MGNRIEYHPSAAEVWERAEIVQWMSAMEWPIVVMDAIMYDGEPPISTVRRMVWQHGPVRALEILQSFLE